jgi:hypothetical protein
VGSDADGDERRRALAELVEQVAAAELRERRLERQLDELDEEPAAPPPREPAPKAEHQG